MIESSLGSSVIGLSLCFLVIGSSLGSWVLPSISKIISTSYHTILYQRKLRKCSVSMHTFTLSICFLFFFVYQTVYYLTVHCNFWGVFPVLIFRVYCCSKFSILDKNVFRTQFRIMFPLFNDKHIFQKVSFEIVNK